MDQTATESSAIVNEESNNNNELNGIKQQTVYDVLGGNDQELARCQYLDDEADSNELGESLLKRKKLARQEDEVENLSQETNGNNWYQSSPAPANSISTNGIQSDYSSYSDEPERPNVEDDEVQKQQSFEEPEQMRKLFIGGLDYKTSEVSLRQHFEKFGNVIDCVVKREPQSKRSRGFGFVIYANSSMVDKAQEARPHIVDGRKVEPKRAISREDSGKPETQPTVKKVYLGGLSDDIEESELRDYFKDFGNIVNVNIVVHRDTGKRRGFAFVEFDDYDPVDKIVLRKFHTIRDKKIEAKKAIPKVEMDARKRGDPRASMAGPVFALPGPSMENPGRARPSRSGGSCLWDGPYGGGSYPGYSSQSGYGGYPPHYHSPSGHYGASNWMMHGCQGGGPYGFRGAHGNSAYDRGNYANQASNWTTASEYGAFPASQGSGPMRLTYQHRSWGPYGGGYGPHRGRGYNP